MRVSDGERLRPLDGLRRLVDSAARLRQSRTHLLGLIRRRRPKWPGDDGRVAYQRRYVAFDIEPGERVLDLGSGGFPFPFASVLADRFRDKSPTRHEALVTDDKPFVVSDIHDLPFGDKVFDFVYCSHVL
jgi:Methyltransferase domain